MKCAYNGVIELQLVRRLRLSMTGKLEIPLLENKKQFPNTADSYVVVFVKCERPRGFKTDGVNRTFDMRQVTSVFEYQPKEYKALLEEELKEIQRQGEESAKEAKLNNERSEKRSHLQAIRQFKLSEKEKLDMIDSPDMSDEEIDKLNVNDLKR